MKLVVATLALGISATGAAANPTVPSPVHLPAGLQLPDTDTEMALRKMTAARNLIGLWKCVTGATIICYGVYTRKHPGAEEYTWTGDYIGKIKLFDNLRVEHAAIRGSYVNGRGKPEMKTSLGQDDAIWFAVEFADGADDIKSARVIFPDDRGFGKVDLTAPVEKQ